MFVARGCVPAPRRTQREAHPRRRKRHTQRKAAAAARHLTAPGAGSPRAADARRGVPSAVARASRPSQLCCAAMAPDAAGPDAAACARCVALPRRFALLRVRLELAGWPDVACGPSTRGVAPAPAAPQASLGWLCCCAPGGGQAARRRRRALPAHLFAPWASSSAGGRRARAAGRQPAVRPTQHAQPQAGGRPRCWCCWRWRWRWR